MCPCMWVGGREECVGLCAVNTCANGDGSDNGEEQQGNWMWEGPSVGRPLQRLLLRVEEEG